MKYSNDHNFIGVSFITQDENDDHYLDDKCFEDILDELDSLTNKSNNFYYNNSQKNSYKNIINPFGNNQYEGSGRYFYSSASKFYPNNYKTINNQSDKNNNSKLDNYFIKNLKDSFNVLMSQIDPSQSAKITIASILKQLGYNDNEILRTIGNYRGVISISSNNRYKK